MFLDNVFPMLGGVGTAAALMGHHHAPQHAVAWPSRVPSEPAQAHPTARPLSDPGRPGPACSVSSRTPSGAEGEDRGKRCASRMAFELQRLCPHGAAHCRVAPITKPRTKRSDHEVRTSLAPRCSPGPHRRLVPFQPLLAAGLYVITGPMRPGLRTPRPARTARGDEQLWWSVRRALLLEPRRRSRGV